MKGKLSKRAPLRKVLVSIQFAVVLFVLCCAGIIHQQLQFLRQQDLGFEQEQVIRLNLNSPEWFPQYKALKEILLQQPEILAVGSGDFIPGTNSMARRPISANGTAGPEPQFVRYGAMDYQYAEALGLELASGRSFSREHPVDLENSIIINEAFVKQFGLEEPVVGQAIRYGDKGNPNFMQIIGVFKDFHHSTLHTPIEPQSFTLSSAPQVVVKVGPDLPTALKQIEVSWREVMPNTPFAFQFLSDELQQGYEEDQVRGKMFTAFSVFTLIICFLGLFGLAAYLAGQRVQEIGIRKVLGARVQDLLLLLTREFVWLVLLAAPPAFLLAWYVSQQWLETFAFHVGINAILYLGVLLSILLLTFCVTGLQAIRAARLNPVEALRQA
jgi:putative ABC transport system permease protein